ncbi:unnamed protein product [Ilex paraguariensis]|uniref:Uncharacterized protein n=1 Tax=Ilex paraguariensis TaxID=185542 RepID=A0ABC8QQZ3_9AQUA
MSPEHPSFRARGRSMLSADQKSFRDYSDDIASSRLVIVEDGVPLGCFNGRWGGVQGWFRVEECVEQVDGKSTCVGAGASIS